MLKIVHLLKERSAEVDKQAEEVKLRAKALSDMVDDVCEVLGNTEMFCQHAEKIDHELNSKLADKWDLTD